MVNLVMNQEIALTSEMSLGSGRSIQPPDGWLKEGWITQSELWLEPKSRLRWCPPATQTVSLHWSLSATPLPAEVMKHLLESVARPPGWLSVDLLLPLSPALIRIPVRGITRATIVAYPDAVRMLGVEYVMQTESKVGLVFYAPTESSDQGEFEILAYEGKEPDYSTFWQAARSALESFRIDRSAPKPSAGATQELPDAMPSAIDKPLVAAMNGQGLLLIPESGGVDQAASTPEAPSLPAPTCAADVPGTTEIESLADPGDQSLPNLIQPESTTGKSVLPPVSESKQSQSITNQHGVVGETSLSRAKTPEEIKLIRSTQLRSTDAHSTNSSSKPRRRTAELSRLGTVVHILQPGETIKRLVNDRWPDLDEESKEIKRREISALNRIHKNPIETWNLQPGMRILLPAE